MKGLSKIAKYSRFARDYVFSRKPTLAYIGGVYGSNNLGDEALRQAASVLFSKCTLLEFPRKGPLAKLARHMLPVRNAVLAGGTLINQKREWYDLVAIYSPLVSNFIVFGSGVAHPTFWGDFRKEWAALLERFQYVGVRGPLSAQLLAEANVKNVEIIGDPVLVFGQDSITETDSQRPQVIGLNIGWDSLKQWGDPESIILEMSGLAARAKAAGWRVMWFVVCPADKQKTLHAAIASDTAQEIHEVYYDVPTYVRLVQQCRVFIGSRLHSVVLATCAYVPSIMIEYRPKCRDYMMSIDQECSVMRADLFRADEAWERACDFDNNHSNASRCLHTTIIALRNHQRLRATQLQETMS